MRDVTLSVDGVAVSLNVPRAVELPVRGFLGDPDIEVPNDRSEQIPGTEALRRVARSA